VHACAGLIIVQLHWHLLSLKEISLRMIMDLYGIVFWMKV